MTSLLSTSDTCVSAGKGMATTWTLTGSDKVYEGGLTTTDGYQIVASFKWVDITAVTTNTAAETLTNLATVMGTCVETMADNGTALDQYELTRGN